MAGLGTTGTLMGAGSYLKQRNPDVELVGVQPAEPFHGIEGLKHLATAIVPPIYDASIPDRQLAVDTDDAFDVARELARIEGLFAGTSTGAALAAARRLGEEAAAGEYRRVSWPSPRTMAASIFLPDFGVKISRVSRDFEGTRIGMTQATEFRY